MPSGSREDRPGRSRPISNPAAEYALRAAGLAGDLARLVALGALMWALITWSAPDIARFAAVIVLLVVPRTAGLARPFDAAFGWTLLLATVASTLHWYATIGWIDLLIHCITTGAVAAMTMLVLARVGLMPTLHGPAPRRHHAALVLLTTATGFTIGVLWEFYEWLADRVLGIDMIVGYTDTIADLAMDGLGALIAGLALTAWALLGFTRRRAPLDKQHTPERGGA